MMRFRLGRVLLWTIAVWLGLLGLVPGPGSGDLLLMAAICGVLAALSTWSAWLEERESARRRRASWMLSRLALGAVLFGGAALLMWWRHRRDAKVAMPPPPLPADVDRWAQAELRAESQSLEQADSRRQERVA